MKVLLINGSPNAKGCTYRALCEAEKVLNEEGIETEILHIGNKPIGGCIACRKCRELKKCAFDDIVNIAAQKAREADGFIFGSPVHFAAISGAMSCFMDRLFFSARDAFLYKPAASVVSARRAGTTAAYDQMNKYIGISKMIMVPANYWNMVHGNTPEEVEKDAEGLMTMRTIGRSLAWIVKMIRTADESGLERPKEEAAVSTNFIR